MATPEGKEVVFVAADGSEFRVPMAAALACGAVAPSTSKFVFESAPPMVVELVAAYLIEGSLELLDYTLASHSSVDVGVVPDDALAEATRAYALDVAERGSFALASIKGGAIPVDQRSVNADGENDASVERYLKDEALKAEVAGTPVFTSIDPAGYDALFLPGGHGTMFDYPVSDELARLVERFDREGKIVAAVCHGPAGLVSAKKADGTPLVAGRRVAGFTDSEERAVGLDQAVPFLLETRLKELGGKHEGGPDFAPFALHDGNLVTGQNPASATRTAELVMEALQDKVA